MKKVNTLLLIAGFITTNDNMCFSRFYPAFIAGFAYAASTHVKSYGSQSLREKLSLISAGALAGSLGSLGTAITLTRGIRSLKVSSEKLQSIKDSVADSVIIVPQGQEFHVICHSLISPIICATLQTAQQEKNKAVQYLVRSETEFPSVEKQFIALVANHHLKQITNAWIAKEFARQSAAFAAGYVSAIILNQFLQDITKLLKEHSAERSYNKMKRATN